MAGPRITICSGCLNEFPNNDMYTVSKASHGGDPKYGIHRLPHCAKCIVKNKGSYIKITEEPKKPKKK
tara:strand:- start:107 stop:310 length:204 start_codon:yes stop_codon:yes gene_type:complete